MEPTVEQMIAETAPAETGAEATPETAPIETPETAPQEFEYSANGKMIKEPLDVILKRASQGYNYAQHMSDYKKNLTDFEARESKVSELEQKYGEIDKFAAENPEWNDHLHKSWESRFDITGKGQQDQSTQTDLNPQFQQEFNELKSFVENIKAERADQAYEASLQNLQQTYPDIDFKATDPDTGKSLEQQVLDYADQNAIGRFEPAFKAFYSDKLVEQARLQAKDQMAGDLQKRAKAGLLGTSQAPTTRSSSEMDMPSNYKQMSTDQLHNWIVNKYAT